jgi:hypothetical protein
MVHWLHDLLQLECVGLQNTTLLLLGQSSSMWCP